ncbi:spore germination protein [Paenibacillus doosanensis]|uniref:spore germination protein n=1 Tax=Paenibacillus doosanensis TaxID=1229154 RepID=UPI0021803BDF|nr:spore germination protein [Paenibacillus doosanensis]MCS7463944.1 spore germination protein [Paenibacillus doosanensis]
MISIDELFQPACKPSDLQEQPLYFKDGAAPAGLLVFLSTITNKAKIEELLLTPFQSLANGGNGAFGTPLPPAAFQYFSSIGEWVPGRQRQLLLTKLYAGHCLFLLNGKPEALVVDVSEWQSRSISPPETESSLVGPRDAFIENLETNIALIRARIRHESLTAQSFVIGNLTGTNVTVMHLDGIANRQMVDQIVERIQTIRIDGVVDTTQVANLILEKNKWWSPFPLSQSTERPDKAVSALLEGRIIILMNSSPTAVILPVTLTSLYQTADDYYFPFLSGSFLRFVRLVGLFLTVFLPAFYISITTINQDVLRIQFMLAIAASREGVPYPAYIEVCIMVFLLELINEASVRLPRVIGGTATIVGGLIIGTAAAQAHLISNIMIVITAATAIGSFTTPNYMVGVALRMCSYILIALAIPLGLYGMTLGTAFIFLYLCHLKSLGVPYLAPFDTFLYKDLFRDGLTRAPLLLSRFRPSTYRADSKSKMSRKEGEKLL